MKARSLLVAWAFARKYWYGRCEYAFTDKRTASLGIRKKQVFWPGELLSDSNPLKSIVVRRRRPRILAFKATWRSPVKVRP
jgi:hypothetical protein